MRGKHKCQRRGAVHGHFFVSFSGNRQYRVFTLSLALGILDELPNPLADGLNTYDADTLMAIGLVTAGALLSFGGRLAWNMAAARAMFERAPLPLTGKRVTREDYPLVWDIVTSIAVTV